LADRPVADGVVHQHRIPVLFVHVITRQDGGISFPQINRVIRVAFEIYTVEQLDVRKGEDLAPYLVYERIRSEGEFFGHVRKGKAAFPKLFNMHNPSGGRRDGPRNAGLRLKADPYRYAFGVAGGPGKS